VVRKEIKMSLLDGKKTIITAVVLGLINLIRMFYPDIPILEEKDVVIAINVIGTILVAIFRLIAKPKPVV